MKVVEILGKIIWKCLALLPLFFIVANYFTMLKPEQRTWTTGWIFLAVSVVYFGIALFFAIKNW